MLEDIRILTSRRAYEFRPDDLRLSVLSTRPVQEQVQEQFAFQAATMGSPFPTFGEVPATNPPGFAFNMGVWISPEEQLVPIRFLHFEPTRIVIDTAGPSSAVTAIYEHIRTFFAELKAPDGSPVIGEPEQMLDYSEIVATYPFALDMIIAEPFRKILNTALIKGSDKGKVMIPSIFIQSLMVDEKFVIPPHFQGLGFSLREGTQPEERIYFSSGPLDSDTHLSYLNKLAALVSP
jgi:hypothetical protein